MSYLPIEEHGVIGDMHTAALVGVDGTIDWLCYPHFDSPSVFASILDDHKGGHFRIGAADEDIRHRQLYHPDTNVLITRFLSPGGVGEVIDFMPVDPAPDLERRHLLVRIVRVVRGAMRFHLECMPAFNYARTKHTLKLYEDRGASFHTDTLSLGLSTTTPLHRHGHGVHAEFTLEAGGIAAFGLQRVEDDEGPGPLQSYAEYDALRVSTVMFWRRWLSQCTYHGRWREMVRRSALALKLLTFEPTGAIVAAPTTSLPESIGFGRNWDYRYTWIRDASFTLYALLRIGFTSEAEKFFSWIEARCRELGADGSLQVLYGVDGRHKLEEFTLDHFEGYRGSGPVRVGNAAYNQLQLDIYGELLDSIYLYNRSAVPISYDLWTNVQQLLSYLCKHWREADEGLWEVRAGRKQFTYSKIMCWVAIDRAMRIARNRSLPAPWEEWRSVRDTIFTEIIKDGWNPDRRAFTQFYGSRALDAASLLIPVVRFLGPTDPRVVGTIEGIQQELVSDSLVYRYDLRRAAADGLEGQEGTFSLCTFWFVEGLMRIGQHDEARLVLEKMFTYANHLGLYAEQIGPSGEALGNFPQALSHLSLITAAFNLNSMLDRPGVRLGSSDGS